MEEKMMERLHENYVRRVEDLPPVEGEVVEPGMNWCWFTGYKDGHAAFLRWCELTGQDVPPELEEECCKYFGVDTEFRLHY
jgi:hypothetical protein